MDKVSKTENMLYEAMLNLGLRPIRQYQISRMKVDFAFPKERLVVEVDGHYKRNSVGMKTLFERKRACEKEGWKVENFTAEEVFEDPDNVARRIYHTLKNEDRKNKNFNNWDNKNKHRESYPRDKSMLVLDNYNKNFKRKKINKIDKIVKTGAIIAIIIIFIWVFGIRHLINPEKTKLENQQENINESNIPEQPQIEPIIVTGGKTDITIKNSLEEDISLNVTYRIYSDWFGKDSTESNIFDINAGEEKLFKVYNNDGCNTAPCSVSIINFEKV